MNNKTLLIAGATGLTGKAFTQAAADYGQYAHIFVLVRAPQPEAVFSAAVEQIVFNYADAAAYARLPKVTETACFLGTTIAAAGSQDKFREVDYRYPMQLARGVLTAGCTTFAILTAIGADPSSKVFYSRVKGEAERDLSALGFNRLLVFRPSLLLGGRTQRRPAEAAAQVLLGGIRGIIPQRYRPITANETAKAVLTALSNKEQGLRVYENEAMIALSTQRA